MMKQKSYVPLHQKEEEEEEEEQEEQQKLNRRLSPRKKKNITQQQQQQQQQERRLEIENEQEVSSLQNEQGQGLLLLQEQKKKLGRLTSSSPLMPSSSSSASSFDLNIKSKSKFTSIISRKKQTQYYLQRLRRFFPFCLVIGVLIVFFFVFFSFIKTKKFEEITKWIQLHSFIGGLVYVCGFILCIVCCFPSTFFEILAGYLFDFWKGLVLTTCGKLIGSSICFFIGRYSFSTLNNKNKNKNNLNKNKKKNKLLKGLQILVNKKPWTIVFLTRLAFFPIAIKNYGLSMFKEISFFHFFIASFTTGLGFSTIWVYTGQTIQNLQDFLNNNQKKKDKKQKEMILLLFGAFSAIVLVGLIGYYTKKHVVELTTHEEIEIEIDIGIEIDQQQQIDQEEEIDASIN